MAAAAKLGVACLTMTAVVVSARADDQTGGPGTIVTIGGYGINGPKFEGSKRQEFSFRPILGSHTVGTREWLELPNDGFDYEFIETDNFRAGAVGNFKFSRDTNTIVRGFKHLRSIDLSLEGGGFAEYWPASWLRTRVEVRGAILGADGVVGDVSADLVLHPTPQWTATAGPRISFGDKTYMASYYSINAQQSAASGLAQYQAGAGLRSYGAGASVQYKWSDAWTTLGYAEYSRLAPAAAESPLIDERGSPNQLTVGIGAKYSFRIN